MDNKIYSAKCDFSPEEAQFLDKINGNFFHNSVKKPKLIKILALQRAHELERQRQKGLLNE